MFTNCDSKLSTLELVCKGFGWQGGTIHQAKADFLKANQKMQDHICGLLVDNIHNITDPQTASWFTRARIGEKG